MHVYDVPAAWLDTENYSEDHSKIPNCAASMPIPHKPYEINLWRSNDLQRGG